ncbi:hypothetical protein SLEP1_g14791 [Rubroshorea leprosula]|uniref:Pentatricopeptide repeat-containing protein n=1 Tax=Rubroshorea leprosula TaxID=152421 RepID=A0AAV5IVP5_9ROSI|nr:hypothetical protein SLEP1_g14791 [Rubroshorea leprosula]
MFNKFVNCLCGNYLVDLALSTLGKMLKMSIPPDVTTFNLLILGEAVKLLRNAEQAGFQPDSFAYFLVIERLSKDCLITEAWNLFSEIKGKGVLPSVYIYCSLTQAICNSGMWEEASYLLAEMAGRGMEPDYITWGVLIKALSKDVIEAMTQQGVEPNVFMYYALVDKYCWCEEIDEAGKNV